MEAFSSASSVWLTGFWGFSPEEEGILGFTDERDRTRFLGLMGERQLVCIYGAASPNTDRRIVHQLLGILDLERTPIDSWDKMSEHAKKRNISLGFQRKWRFAMPARRAWRTSHNLDVKQIFPRSYDPANGRYIARFGTWLDKAEAKWLLERVPFVETSVFGEPPLSATVSTAPAAMETRFHPSRAVLGGFGTRSFEVRDRPHCLYLAHFPAHPELMAGRHIEKGTSVVKIGITGDIKIRLKALNLSFAPSALVEWKILRTANFADREQAAAAEQKFKDKALSGFGGVSLGKEFFVLKTTQAEMLFNQLSPATGLVL